MTQKYKGKSPNSILKQNSLFTLIQMYIFFAEM